MRRELLPCYVHGSQRRTSVSRPSSGRARWKLPIWSLLTECNHLVTRSKFSLQRDDSAYALPCLKRFESDGHHFLIVRYNILRLSIAADDCLTSLKTRPGASKPLVAVHHIGWLTSPRRASCSSDVFPYITGSSHSILFVGDGLALASIENSSLNR